MGEGVSHCEDKHARWEENQQYTRGEQWSKADIERQERREKPAVPWNDTFKVVHAIANREMVARLVPKVFGRSRADDGPANILDEVCRWQRQGSDSEHFESMAFRSAAMCGYGVAHKYWDPIANNGEGQIRDRDVPLVEMLWPARAREMNLSDRRWHINGKWVDVDVAEEMWGSESRSIASMFKKIKVQRQVKDPIVSTEDLNENTQAPSSTGWSWGYVRRNQFVNLSKNEIFVIEHEWLEEEFKFRAAVPKRFRDWVSFVSGGGPLEVESQDPQTGQPMVIPVELERFQSIGPEEQKAFRDAVLADTKIEYFEDRKGLNEFLDLYSDVMNEEFELFAKVGARVVKYAILINEKVVEYGVRPFGYSYHFITGFPFETRDGMDFYGAVDIVKGPQDYKNALISNMLSMYMTSPKGLLLIEKGLVANQSEFMDQVSSPAGAILVENGFFANERHKFLPPPQYPPMLGPLLELAGRGVEGSLGISPIDLNVQDDLRRVSGKVVQASQLASNVIVAILFDSMRKFRRAYGMCNVRFLRLMYDPVEMLRIAGDEKAEDFPQDPEVWEKLDRYDITIDEQPVSATERMELLERLTVTGELTAMRNRGDITFEDQVKHFMPYLPESDKRDILKNRTIAEQKAMVEQQNQQLMTVVQELYQRITAMPGGQQALAGTQAELLSRQMAQGAFSQPGVPAQPQQAQLAAK